ncbi:selenium cofactor biosynthesis protein YqeC [Sporomusa sphaeroides]|uniref:Selenium-dependent hydroxylase accessory protein YqeC n=1 Tax=Sporomusa sphaeroides DSM 2875 TaxID=1337886 RepID=A0ABM9W800_9FIRM|nr:selenium cofactor biosynthesis protein YqeC [Sporomusa sphaeroides]OLS55347.1 hypothetical protein SPSPH_33950 [Sporomusa sphaeroides DSM 2875]CVK21275.1 hypothetical protein SSPH_03962 [Sporomusa sphaeroides DSM 2875]
MLWDALGITLPGMIACVGAGGKTSLLQSLAKSAGQQGRPVLLTATTKMFYNQVADFQPVVTDDYAAGQEKVVEALKSGKIIAWLSRQNGGKVLGLPPEWLAKLAAEVPAAYILVEADGARCSKIKAPAPHEPVIPAGTAMTVGVLNLSTLGQPLTADNAHRLDLVAAIISKQAGANVEWQDIARLAVHRQGIFQHARGTKVLLLSGGDIAAQVAAAQIAGYCKLAKANIERVVVTAGYGCSMKPLAVYRL